MSRKRRKTKRNRRRSRHNVYPRPRLKGISTSRDSKRHAKKPGWRKSKRGRWYYERRANRADIGYWI